MMTEEQRAKRDAELNAQDLKKIKEVLGEEAMNRVMKMTGRGQIMGIGNTLTFLASRLFPEAPDPHFDRLNQQACDWLNSQMM